MDLAHAHRTLEDGLAPATADLRRQQDRAAFRFGLFAGVHSLPPFAAVLTLGWFGASYVAGAPLFTPLALPLILLIVPLGIALPYPGALRRRRRAEARDAAVVVDRNNATKDRLSAALELSADSATAGAGTRAALARAAVADGVATLPRVDVSRTSVEVASMPFPAVPAILAFLITLIPAMAQLAGSTAEPVAPATPVAAVDEAGQREEEATAERGERAEEAVPDPESAASPQPRAGERPQREREPDEPRPEPSGPPNQPRGAGAGAAPTDASSERGRRAPTAGETKAATAAAATASGQGGGGRGAAKSETPSEPDERRERSEQKPRTNQQKRPSETEGGEQEQSAGNPSGPSRGGGRMAAVGNQRSGIDRGRDRDDDPETEDEDVEDEEEETEQRGGVMPMTRDRMSAASRELSISGNGPPDDGRGGPTAPKKSRGTASLVLGVRLPDQVRGQPNPGTAKTTIEQIPPVPQDQDARPATPAPSAGPSPHVQSRALPLGDLAAAVRRYHELLRTTAGGTATTPPAPNPNRDE